MKRTAKKLAVAAAIAAVSIQTVPDASACGGRGGRPSFSPIYGGYARAASNYRATLPTSPPIRYTQQPVTHVQPSHPQTSVPVARPAAAANSVAAVQPRPRAQVAMQTAAAQQVGNQQAVNQPATNQVTARPVTTAPKTTADAETSALAALASIASNAAPAATTPAAATPAANVRPSTTAGTPQVPQFTAASTTTAPHIGVFTATLPSNVTIELRLTSGNTFSWIVRNNGKVTQFNGQYRVSQGRLTLVRSQDLQQMAGTMTTASNGFTFKLDGTNNAGLNFKRG